MTASCRSWRGMNCGRLLLSVEASDGGRMHKLAWGELRQQRNAPGIEYSFKYFQQVEGDLLLPAGVKPVRVIARLVPASGAAVEQSFTWSRRGISPSPPRPRCAN